MTRMSTSTYVLELSEMRGCSPTAERSNQFRIERLGREAKLNEEAAGAILGLAGIGLAQYCELRNNIHRGKRHLKRGRTWPRPKTQVP